jgi:hypothetical protein
LTADSLYEWLFWDDSFAYSEVAIRPGPAIERELEGYIRRVGAYPEWMLKVDRLFPRFSAWLGRKLASASAETKILMSSIASTLARKRSHYLN